MKVEYVFDLSENEMLNFVVDFERTEALNEVRANGAAAWTQLDHCKCSNCPLGREVTHCPAALDLQEIVNSFKELPSYQKVDVTVKASGRVYSKHTSLEEGLRSLMGVVMASSGCPILSELKPMALHHLPFSSTDEFILRTVSIYLLQQYFNMRGNQQPDWELKGLVDRHKQLQLVNQALWQRIHTACDGDSNLKALLSFFSMASSVSFSLESQLQKLKTTLDGGHSTLF